MQDIGIYRPEIGDELSPSIAVQGKAVEIFTP